MLDEPTPLTHGMGAPDEIWPLHPSNVGTGLPLEGVRILDLSRVLAGPLCAMIAGDLGADVIKVESPDGDPVRAMAPPRFGDDATYYLAVNRHRRNVVADLRHDRDRALVGALVARADAVVENFLPQQAVALGVSQWREANPNVVWVSVTSASSGGDLVNQPTFDLLAQARSGIMGVTGAPEGEPMKVGAPISDVVTGLYGCIGLLGGLFARATQREGRHFEAPLLESTMSVLMNQAQGFLATGRAPTRLGNHHPSITPYGPVRTCDGYLMLAVGTDAQFARLVAVLEDPVLSRRVEFATNNERVARRDKLQEELDRIFSTASTEAWLERLRGSGVPFAPILDVEGAFEQPQIRQGDLVGFVETPAGPLRMVRSPLSVDGARPQLRRGPRALGQDNEELGF